MEKRVFNQDKTQELTDYDLSLGRLQEDKLVLAHHDAVDGKTVEENVAAAQEDGKTVKQIGGVWYVVTAAYENGGEELSKVLPTEHKDAWDETEDIFIYIPYSDAELLARRRDKLRARREAECFSIVDRGALWYEKLTPKKRAELTVWYEAWLDAPQTLSAPPLPSWLSAVTDNTTEL